MKIATWNVNSLRVRLEHVVDWLKKYQPDVLAVQETKTEDKTFPLDEIEAAGYNAVFSGQKSYNGVALLTRKEPQDVITDLPNLQDPQRRIMEATVDGVRILNLYVPNGSSLDSDKYPYKLDWLARVKDYLNDNMAKHERYVILGDFNIAPEDRDVCDPKAWEGNVLVSAPERAALAAIEELGFVDCFRSFEQDEKAYSWWNYRQLAFRRNRGLRIDLILANKSFAANCQSCIIDREPRKLERPSDHAPVMAEFN